MHHFKQNIISVQPVSLVNVTWSVDIDQVQLGLFPTCLLFKVC